jgi:hypothetical protein
MSAFLMPTTYMPPFGTPLYWMDEQTGVLPDAMRAYVFHAAKPETHPAPDASQLALVISYFRYVINAPCWRADKKELVRLRGLAARMTTTEEVEQFLGDCLEIGLDPI